MAITSTIEHDKHLVITTCRGAISIKDLADYQNSVWTNKDLFGYNELYDFADSDYSNVSFEDLVTVAENAAKVIDLDPNARFAFLVHTPQHQSIADFYLAAKAFTTGPSREIRAFTNREQALDWLNENTAHLKKPDPE